MTGLAITSTGCLTDASGRDAPAQLAATSNLGRPFFKTQSA
jgi:hypothetical protein